jgi:thiamine biosynthesis lipoprotein
MASAACLHCMTLHSPENNRTSEQPLEVSRARPLLGTLVQIRASGPSTRIQQVVEAAFTAIEQVQQLLSYQDPGSELSALNQQSLFEPRRVHADTYAVLDAALHFARLSDGAFDPCVGLELEQWGLLPSRTAMRPRVSAGRGTWRDIELLPDRQVCLHRPVWIDLGGIAKGYAVDVALRALLAGGAYDAVVNAGGDLRVAGPRVRQVALRHPLAPDRTSESVPLLNAALATSGAYYSRQHRREGDVSALVDPTGRRPHLDPGSVSVRAATCMGADALTKVVLFAQPEVAERALSACNAIAFVQQPRAAKSFGYPRHSPAHHSIVAHAH